MSVYAIAQSQITDEALLEQYVEAAMPTLTAHGVKILAFDAAPKSIEGTLEYPRTVVLEFESEQAFNQWYESPEYQAAKKIRKDASIGTFTLVQGM